MLYGALFLVMALTGTKFYYTILLSEEANCKVTKTFSMKAIVGLNMS